ncbi:similar to ribonuclease H [Mycoplasma suis KI3806]|uniref:Similar to ribonuclease H n=1 Tax=Mycoplasma suis (strain KI_3806) TaxID=708248 RepID=F0V303_MYCS3|nr:ribonuclease H [Mycoplasma suis]CBZ40225.1 similar to ribonuclease H [Mycoplasma suis KI3806]
MVRKFFIPIVLAGAGTSVGAGYGLSRYWNSEQQQLEENYGKNAKVFAQFIRKTNDNVESFDLFCEKWVSSDEGDRRAIIPEFECQKSFQQLPLRGEKVRAEKWLEVEKNRFKDILQQYFSPLSEENESLVNENFEGEWNHGSLICENSKSNEGQKVIVSCYDAQEFIREKQINWES